MVNAGPIVQTSSGSAQAPGALSGAAKDPTV
jgi:hypothetical protein